MQFSEQALERWRAIAARGSGGELNWSAQAGDGARQRAKAQNCSGK